LALCEGAAAGEAVCADRGRSTGSARRAIRRLHSRRARLQRFAAAMQRAHPVPAGWLEALADDTTICRCEEIPYGSVREVLRRHGAADARQLKQLSRVGMGWCQGRVCGFAADLVTARLTGETPVLRPPPRPVATPITLGMLASASAEPTAKISESGEASDD
ncbi:MAG: (2Fe-2S)-binding protein, partial [Microlunatus sp.]|nr:(2Fe-2S)-binding protein [Microlunatus sp.]